jgi:transcriptional regulator with XRE-family HTH domain
MTKKARALIASGESMASEEVQKALGQRLRNVRRNKGLSQKVVAKIVGMPVSELRQIENGELDIHLSFVVAIAEVFDIPVSRLFHGIA